MFKNEFQGGTHVDVFSANGKDPLNKWKNPALKRDFEKDVKGYIYILEGSTTTAKLQLPGKDSKQSLSLIQRFFVAQVLIPLSKDFAVELMMTDIKNGKRRVVLSTSVKDIAPTPLHAKLPLSFVKRDVWLNLCFDLVSLISDVFPSQTFKSLESVALSGNCKVRRAFTMKNQPFDSSGLPDDPTNTGPCESIPNSLQFSSTVQFVTQVISVPKIKLHVGPKLSRGDAREPSGYWSSSSDDLSSSRRLSARDPTPTHIAFGTKVPVNSRTRNKSLSSSIKDRLTASNNSIGNQTSRSTSRKVRSSIARLASPASDKENADLNSSIRVAAPALLARDSKHKLETINQDRNLDELPSMLANLVDELDVSTEGFKNGLNADVSNSTVFKFSSQPHSVPRSRTESGSTQNEQHLEEDFLRSPASSDSDDSNDIQESILRHTPSPRNVVCVNPLNKVSQDFSKISSPVRNINQPQASLSPDISRLHSPNSQLYDSKKYSDKFASRSSLVTRKPPIAQMSLRSSDATLTASVDTLVQTITRESSEGLGDSLDDRDMQKHTPLESDVSPPRKDPQKSFNGSQGPYTVHRKSFREIEKAQTIHENPTLPSSQYQVASLSDSFEANMLASMMQETEKGMMLDDEPIRGRENVSFHDDPLDESFGASWSTYRNPPPMQPDAYESEMKNNNPSINNNTLNGFTLAQSNPRDWGNLLSPPTVMPNIRMQQKKDSLSDVESVGNDSMGLSNGSSCASVKSSTTGGETDEEEMLELLYDPCLNCYFDPKTGKYYELKT
uniref:Uncharacterized protein C3orf67 homolog n=1 Tax=Phallusia mammillata TaxID=59560 RepID=A0A6F9D8P4_9ASCI|nr:uncharacterized protein C3orf67 homolog [Phallusia mammillata]